MKPLGFLCLRFQKAKNMKTIHDFNFKGRKALIRIDFNVPLNDDLKVTDETQIRAKGLSPEAQEEIRQVIAKHGGEGVSIENPKSTLEELFLGIVRESQERPGLRSSGATKESSK